MGIRFVPRAVCLLLVFAGLGGCQSASPMLGSRLIANAAMIDFSGLAPSAPISGLNVQAAVPRGWSQVPHQSTLLFEHDQWRSPSRMSGLGIAYIHLPWPMSARTLLWFAKSQYSNKHADHKPGGQLIGEWTDAVGREWFEAENTKYHVRGYAVTDGFDAWVVYSGYRLRGTPSAVEMSLAARAMDSVVPLPLLNGKK